MASENSKNLAVGGPDAFQAQAYTLLDKLQKNPKPLVTVLGLILAAAVIGFSVKYYVTQKQEDRKIALTKVDAIYESEMKKYQDAREAVEKKKDALVAAQPSPKTPGEVPAESPEIAALNAQLQAIKPEHKESAEKYKSFFEANAKFPEGWVAGLRYASYAAENKDFEGAQKVLEPIIRDSKGLMVVQVQALFLSISVLEDTAAFDKALEQADALIKVVPEELKPRALLTKGQIFYLKKDYPNAKQSLDQLLNEHAESPEADRARTLLALLPA